jgi:hypothetical protein
MNTIKKKTEVLLEACRDFGLDVNAEDNKYILNELIDNLWSGCVWFGTHN